MKITSIETEHYRFMHTRAIRNGKHVYTHSNMFLVKIETDEGVSGIAEGRSAPQDMIERVRVDLLGEDPIDVERLWHKMWVPKLTGRRGWTTQFISAIDIALWDIRGKVANMPLYKLLGLTKYQTPITSFTIGIDDPETIREKVRLANLYPVLKVKVGVDRDLQILEAVRDVTDKALRVDANGAWTAREAVERIIAMRRFGIELCEQPVAPGDIDGLRFVRERVEVPIFADESARTPDDIPRLAGAVDGINIKIMKCGGIREAIKMIHLARAFHMKVMLGCNIESSLSITAAAHVSPLVDFADLDGHLLLADDPFAGVKVEKGKLILPDGPGLGVTRRSILTSVTEKPPRSGRRAR